MWDTLLQEIQNGNRKSLARCISLVENNAAGNEQFLMSLPVNDTPVIGITGPPGAGKSTLTDALTALYVDQHLKVAVICVDPSSPFTMGAVLGDRIRMNRWFNEPAVFIRSLAARGSLGGLHPKILEITDIVKAGGFDRVIIETVGVGQSEVEIAGLADATVVTMVPEGGDEIQTMKAGIMEIADLFVVNKADRPGADIFIKNMRQMLAPAFGNHAEEVEIIKTAAVKNEGIAEMAQAIEKILLRSGNNMKKASLLADRAFYLIQKERMKDVDPNLLQKRIEAALPNFNLYSFVINYTRGEKN